MPNGALESHYGTRVLSAGKNPDKSRFNPDKIVDIIINCFIRNKMSLKVPSL